MPVSRILYLDYTNNIGLGGGQRSLALLVRHLPRARFEPLVGCPPGEQLIGILDPGITVLPLELAGRFRSVSRWEISPMTAAPALATAWDAVRRLREIIRCQKIDLVHANNLKMFLVAAAATTRVPVIWHVRDLFPAKALPWVRLAARAARAVLAVSQAVAGQFRGARNVEVLYNAVERPAAALAGGELRRRLGIPAAATVIGYAGRLDRDKGLQTLVDAFLLLRSDDPNLHLLIAGEGPDRGVVEQFPVTLAGFQTDMGPFWDAVDVAVQPSTGPDAFPRSVIEAMAHAKPVVASRIGGIPEAIEDPITGRLVPPSDPRALATALKAVLASPEKARGMGLAGRRRARRLFSVQAQMERLTEFYDGWLERKPRASQAA